jgi:hypothetical protein
MPKTITKLIGIATTFKETIRNMFRDYSALQPSLSLFHPYYHIENVKDIEDIAKQVPFSYFDILPLYERLGKDKEKTLRIVNIYASRGLPLRYVPLQVGGLA